MKCSKNNRDIYAQIMHKFISGSSAITTFKQTSARKLPKLKYIKLQKQKKKQQERLVELGFSGWSHEQFQFLRKCFGTFIVPKLDSIDTEAENITRNKVQGLKSPEI